MEDRSDLLESGATRNDRRVAERSNMKVSTQSSSNYYDVNKAASKGNQKGTPAIKSIKSDDSNTFGMFQALKEAMIEEHKLTKETIKKEDDWREMTDDSWDKLLENMDNYIDYCREEQEKRKELQIEAAKKAAAYAPANRKTEAVAKAVLYAGANGITEVVVPDRDESTLEKSSWTYNLETENQLILAKAKMANEFAPSIYARAQELANTGNTTLGSRDVDNIIDYITPDEDDERNKD